MNPGETPERLKLTGRSWVRTHPPPGVRLLPALLWRVTRNASGFLVRWTLSGPGLGFVVRRGAGPTQSRYGLNEIDR